MKEVVEDEGEGDDLIGEGMMNDYRAIPELDRYDSEGLASDSVSDAMSPEARTAAEQAMRRRDRDEMQRRTGRRSVGELLAPR